jgi:hypothetical protein
MAVAFRAFFKETQPRHAGQHDPQHVEDHEQILYAGQKESGKTQIERVMAATGNHYRHRTSGPLVLPGYATLHCSME